ncbi:MAG: DUF4129 domain-containing protein [Flavobacteriales bacterium]
MEKHQKEGREMRAIFSSIIALFSFFSLAVGFAQNHNGKNVKPLDNPGWYEHEQYLKSKQTVKKFKRSSHGATLKELTKQGEKEGKGSSMTEEEFSSQVEFFSEDELEQTYFEPETENSDDFFNKNYSPDKDYDKVKYLEKKQSALPPRNESSPRSFDMNVGWLKTMMWIILALVVAYVMYIVFLRDLKSNKKVEILEEEPNPTEIPLSELELKLREALARKDYREAIRIYFLYILKLLIERSWIDWHKKKTNLHYLREMSARKEHQAFSNVVTVFEIVWYGKRPVSEDDYNRVEPIFKQLVSQLEAKRGE